MNTLKNSVISSVTQQEMQLLITFYRRYFNLMVHGCPEKFSTPFQDLRNQLKTGKLRQEMILCAAADLLELCTEYANDENRDFTTRRNADKGAKTYSTGNLFGWLVNALTEMIETLSRHEKRIPVEELTTLAAHAYVIGDKKVFKSWTYQDSGSRTLADIHRNRLASRTRMHLLPNHGKCLSITRGQLIASHGRGIAEYEKLLTQKFTFTLWNKIDAFIDLCPQTSTDGAWPV